MKIIQLTQPKKERYVSCLTCRCPILVPDYVSDLEARMDTWVCWECNREIEGEE
jgi:DNA-directed RNA polymerase subunit RPC12/RpoP